MASSDPRREGRGGGAALPSEPRLGGRRSDERRRTDRLSEDRRSEGQSEEERRSEDNGLGDGGVERVEPAS